MTEHEKLLKRFRKWLPGEPNDLADLMSLRAFCNLFTARCLDSTNDGRQMLYRRRLGTTPFELEPAERILFDCAGNFSSVSELVSAAAKGIRQEMLETRRALTPVDAGKFAEIQAGIAEALAYQPPVSSCSV
jgi:hypothetical protein